jgi:hypothetical protein
MKMFKALLMIGGGESRSIAAATDSNPSGLQFIVAAAGNATFVEEIHWTINSNPNQTAD